MGKMEPDRDPISLKGRWSVGPRPIPPNAERFYVERVGRVPDEVHELLTVLKVLQHGGTEMGLVTRGLRRGFMQGPGPWGLGALGVPRWVFVLFFAGPRGTRLSPRNVAPAGGRKINVLLKGPVVRCHVGGRKGTPCRMDSFCV